MSRSSSPALVVENLTRRFGTLTAVDGLNLEVLPGEIVGFLGPNGAGKTTTLGMVAGLLKPDGGAITLLGRDGRNPLARRGVGFLVGPPALWPGLTGLEHLVHARNMVVASGWNGGKDVALPDELLRQVGLEPRDGRRNVREYSQGMRQRLGLAMALAGNPSLLILDEPTNGLDPLGGPDIWEVLQAAAARGVAVLVSTHLLLEVERYCDRAPMLMGGRLAHEDVLRILRSPDLSRKTRLEFLTAADASAAEAGLREWPGDSHSLNGVAASIKNPPVLRDDPETALCLVLSPEAVPGLLSFLGARSLPLPCRIAPEDSNLNDLFLRLAGRTGGSQSLENTA